ncbi:hypothetical protein CBUD_0381 [Coxiella burnetii Dugway 5J108-111]|uniref:Uncharacterized protein n=1 Tax=Coxiella burnetii (strain Dugway 5J108-111) TaxID=434922 RepID=A9KDN0_COXBN|nr:hypothetical protein CBUD_0381 [Coxiella burnetii Dugway 5J108-111]
MKKNVFLKNLKTNATIDQRGNNSNFDLCCGSKSNASSSDERKNNSGPFFRFFSPSELNHRSIKSDEEFATKSLKLPKLSIKNKREV